MEVVSTASDEGMDFAPGPVAKRPKAKAKAEPKPKARREPKRAAAPAPSTPGTPAMPGTPLPGPGYRGPPPVAQGDVVKILVAPEGRRELRNTLASVSCGSAAMV